MDQIESLLQQNLSRLLENIHEFSAILDPQGTILRVHRTPARPAELVGANICSRVLPEYRDALTAALTRAVRTGEVQTCEVAGAFTGSPYLARLIPVLEDGRVAAVLAFGSDISPQKRLEEDLQTSVDAGESHYRALAQAVPDMVFRLDGQGRFLDFVPVPGQRLLVPPSEFLGGTVHNVLPADLARAALRAIQRVLSAGETLVAEFTVRVPLPDGDPFDYEARVSPSGPDEVIAVVRDVTSSRRTLEALRESEERFRRLSEATLEGIVVDDSVVALDANPQIAAMAGCELHEFIGRNPLDFVAPEWRATVMEHVTSAREGFCEALALRKDGTTFPIELRGKVAFHGGREVRLTVVRDLTDRKRAEATLRESEAKHRQVFEHVHDVFYRLDMNGAITDVSPSVRWWGYDPEQLVGTQVADLYEEPQDRAALMGQLLEKGSISDYEVRLKTADGRTMEGSASSHLLRDSDGAVVGIEGIVRDITERKRAEEALRESEERLRGLVANAPVILFAIDSEGMITAAEGKTSGLLPLSPEEHIGRSVFDMYRDLPGVIDAARRALAGESFATVFELQTLTFEAHVTPVRDSEGTITGAIAVATDVTARTRAEKARQETEERLRAVLASAPVMIGAVDGEGVFTAVEGAATSLLPFKPEEHIGRSVFDLYSDMPGVCDAARRALAGEDFNRTADLGPFTVDVSLRPIRDAEGAITGTVAVATNITERAQAEKALRESEERFRRLAEDSIDGILLAEADEVKFVNAAVVKMLGYERQDEILGRPFTDFVSPEHREMTLARAQARRLGREVPSRYELKALRKDGSEVDTETAVSTLTYRGSQAALAVVRDITERKRAEEALRDSERRYRLLAENITDLIWTADLNLNLTYVSPSVERLLGYTVEQCMGMRVEDFLTPASAEIARKIFAESLAAAREDPTVGSRTQEFEMRRRDGSTGWVEVALRFLRDPDAQPAGILGVSRDVTARKQAEEALRQSEAKFRKLAESAAAAIFIYRGTRPLFVNSATEELTGYTQEEILASELWQFVHPDFQALVRERSRARQQGLEAPSRYVFSIVRKSGEERWVDFTATMIEFEGEPAALGTAYDITERRRAENVLRESEGRYRLLAENVTDVIWTADLKLNLTFVSPSISRLTGYTAEEAMTLSFEDILTPGSLDFIKKVYKEEIAGPALNQRDPNRSRTLELEVYRKDGATIWIEASMTFLRGPDGRPTGLLGVARDATERRRAHEALRESEQRFRILSEATYEGIAIHEGGLLLDANPQAAAMFGYEISEMVGMEALSLVAPESTDAASERMRLGPQGSSMELLGLRKDGTSFWMEGRAKNVSLHDRIVQVVAVRDLSERKKAEQALRESEERFRRLSEATQEGIVIHEGGLLLDANPQAAAMLGYELPEIIGKTAFTFIAPEYHDLVRQNIASGCEEAYEISFLKKDGTILPAEICGKPALYQGRPVRMGIMRDISERKRAEEALQRERDELEARVEQRMSRGRRYKLTFRELSVLYFVAAGMADKEIAFRLGISHRTASKHVENILSKMSAMSRTEAGVRAIQEGLVESLG